jgi:hypothetical protein
MIPSTILKSVMTSTTLLIVVCFCVSVKHTIADTSVKPAVNDRSVKHNTSVKHVVADKNPYIGMHEHCPVFNYANSIKLSPKLEQIFGEAWSSHRKLPILWAIELVTPVLPRIQQSGKVRILSIGSGDCVHEQHIADIIQSRFQITAIFTCFEPVGFQFFKPRHNFTLMKNLDSSLPTQDAIFVHHALHHVSDLPTLYSYLSAKISPDGAFVISDMIGCMGHRRWPEQLVYTKEYFAKLSDIMEVKDMISNKIILEYPDYDYACNAGNEGVKVYEVLPLLHNYFFIEKMVAFGGLDFEFVGRRLCNNFDMKNPKHMEFLNTFLLAQENAVSTGKIKPDQMIAVARPLGMAGNVTQKFWKHWTPEFVTRRFDSTELAAIVAVKAKVPCSPVIKSLS